MGVAGWCCTVAGPDGCRLGVGGGGVVLSCLGCEGSWRADLWLMIKSHCQGLPHSPDPANHGPLLYTHTLTKTAWLLTSAFDCVKSGWWLERKEEWWGSRRVWTSVSLKCVCGHVGPPDKFLYPLSNQAQSLADWWTVIDFLFVHSG